MSKGTSVKWRWSEEKGSIGILFTKEFTKWLRLPPVIDDHGLTTFGPIPAALAAIRLRGASPNLLGSTRKVLALYGNDPVMLVVYLHQEDNGDWRPIPWPVREKYWETVRPYFHWVIEEDPLHLPTSVTIRRLGVLMPGPAYDGGPMIEEGSCDSPTS